MKQVCDLWILDDDKFFENKFRETGGTFDYDHLNKALEYVTSDNVAVDCGAHYGSWSIPLSKHFSTVYAFEARPDVFSCLQRNTKSTQNIITRNCAVGHKFDNVDVGTGQWKGRDGNSGIGTVIGPGTIPMIPLDSLKLEHVDFIKVDVEGFELFVLQGAEETLKRCKPVVIFEENVRGKMEHNIERGTVGSFLYSLGAHKRTVIGQDHIYAW